MPERLALAPLGKVPAPERFEPATTPLWYSGGTSPQTFAAPSVDSWRLKVGN